ncbi:MAG: hypothetical protein RIS29_1734 [Bacteroidota bacterium]
MVLRVYLQLVANGTYKKEMAKRKLLNGLPNDLLESFFSPIRYWEKGYMSDWIVNSCVELKVTNVHIDLLNKRITPKELEIQAILCNVSGLDTIIYKVAKHAGFEPDFIEQAVFDIEIYSNRGLKCRATLIGKNGEIFSSKDYFEKSHEEFKVFNRSLFEIGIESLIKKYYRFRFRLLGRRAFGTLRYTKRLENEVK